MKRTATVALFLIALGACRQAPAQTTDARTTAPARPQPTATLAQQSGSPASATPPGPSGAPTAQATKPVPAVLPEVLARVNGEAIEKTEFERALKNVETRAGRQVPPDERDAVYRNLLDQLVAYHLLLQESKTRGITVSDSDVDARIEEVRKQFPTEADFAKVLSAQNTTLDDLKREARQELTLAKLVEAAVTPQVTVAESDIKAFYDNNAERFQQPEAIRASHILIKVDPGASDAEKKAARAKADDLLLQIKGGADFAELAKKFSQDGSAQEGGDLNFFTRGQMVPPFEQAAFALNPNGTSEVVETQFGYHIIRVTDRRGPRTIPLAEAAPRIGQFLTMQQQQARTAEFVNALRARGKVEILI